MASRTGATVQIIGNDEGVQRMLHVLDTALNPLAIAGFLGGVVEPYLQTRARARFASEGDDAVGGWKPLTEGTVQIREALGYQGAHPINRRTGELENYITGADGTSIPTAIGATLTYPNFTPLGELGNKLRVAQQGGSQAGYRDTPARPVLGVSTQDMAFVLLALSHHIKGQGSMLGI